jgi:glycosyltransferase involved in cell wall biosynthesis
MEETDVLSWLSRASLFVEPARYEPFGLAALEAALCGCALVLGDIPSLREVWDDGATFVSPDDPDALARAVNTLLDDPARRNRAASDALAIAAGYPQSANTDAYLAAYRQLVRE